MTVGNGRDDVLETAVTAVLTLDKAWNPQDWPKPFEGTIRCLRA
jgi:hypothetical protein